MSADELLTEYRNKAFPRSVTIYGHQHEWLKKHSGINLSIIVRNVIEKLGTISKEKPELDDKILTKDFIERLGEV